MDNGLVALILNITTNLNYPIFIFKTTVSPL